MKARTPVAGLILLVAPFLSIAQATAEEAVTPPPAVEPVKMSFASVVDRALAANPQFAIALQNVRIAEQQIKVLRAGAYPYTPTVYGYVSGTALDHAREDSGVVAYNQYTESAYLTVTDTLVNTSAWAKTWRGIDSLEDTKADTADVRRQIAVTAAHAYLAVLTQHAQIGVDQDALKNAKEHYAYAHDRLAAGVGTRVDDLRAQQQVASIAASLETAYAGLVSLQETIGVLLALEKPVDTADDPALPASSPLQQYVAEAREQRTDLQALDVHLQRANRATGDAWADYVPMLSVVLQPFQNSPPTETAPTTGYEAYLLLTIPFYDGGTRMAQQNQREAVAVQAQVTLQNALRQASADVRSAFETVRRDDEALKTTREAATLAKQTLTLTEQAYRAGAITNIEVMDAQLASLNADSAVVLAEDASRQGRLNLLAASGRFPEPVAH